MGVAVGDYDNDGDPDLFVTRIDAYALYRNRGDGTFEDATAEAGLAGRRDNPTSAALADLDGDRDLDLYVCHYMIWDPTHPPTCRNERGEYFYCDPSKVEPAPDHAFRNDGGRFVDVTAESGLAETGGRGLGVVAADLDDDHRIDLYVANDGTANYLFRNKGGFRFEEVALEAGVAGSASGGYQAGMGVACGDLDGDGRPDLLVTNFYGEGTTYYQNLGQGLFADRSAAALPAGLRHRPGRRRQCRPSGCPGHERTRQRQSPVLPLCDARSPLCQSPQRPAGGHLETGRRVLGGEAGRPRAGRRRPRQ